MFVIIIRSIGCKPFPLFITNTKKSVRLSVWTEALDKPCYKQESSRKISVSISALSCNIGEIVQISIHLKSKKTLYINILNYLFLFYRRVVFGE